MFDKCGHGIGPQEEFYGCADISIMGNHQYPAGHSVQEPIKPFEPLEIQFQKILQTFRTISMDEVNYSDKKNAYSNDNYQTPYETQVFPEKTSEFETKPRPAQNLVSIKGNSTNTLLDEEQTRTQKPLNVTVKSVIESLLAVDQPETNTKRVPSRIHPASVKSVLGSLLASDQKKTETQTAPYMIPPATIKSAIKSLLTVGQTTSNQNTPPTIDIDALDIKTTQHNGKKVAVLEKLSDMLWSMMKSILVQSNKRNGQNIASVKWDPLKTLGKSPVLNNDVKNRYRFELKSPWPPTRPMIVQADYGIDDIIEGNPIVLSEIPPEEYLKSPILSNSRLRSNFRSRISEFDKYRQHTRNLDTRLYEIKQKRDKMTTTQEMATLRTLECSGADSFLYVKGINTWCTRNCKAGNCPQHMCRCVNKRVKATTSSVLATTLGTTTASPTDPTKPPILPLLSEFNRNDTIKEKISKQPQTVNFLSKEAYLHLYQKNPTLFGQRSRYNATPKNQSIETRNNGPSMKTSSDQTLSSRGNPKRTIICRGKDQYGQQSAIKGWCTENCRKGFCPKRVCVCKYG